MPRYEITIRGIYCADPQIFDVISLPNNDRYHPILEHYILDFFGNMEVCYPNPITMRRMLKAWSDTHQVAWQRLYEALTSEYNPIENYDRQEEWNDYTKTKTQANSDANSHDLATAINDYTPRETTESNAQSNTNGNSDENSWHSGRTHGNIGITTSQQMIQAELDLRENTFIENVANDFKHMFCVQVY